MKAKEKITAAFLHTKEGNWIAWVEEISGINTQGKTLEEAKENLLDAMSLMFECQREITQKNFDERGIIKEEITFV
jgi:predicted RNase H-like HicB family nuclease